jgi:hypothetical protein
MACGQLWWPEAEEMCWSLHGTPLQRQACHQDAPTRRQRSWGRSGPWTGMHECARMEVAMHMVVNTGQGSTYRTTGWFLGLVDQWKAVGSNWR